MKQPGITSETKEQDKPPETDLNEMEISDLPDTEFEIMVIKMYTDVRKSMHDEHSKNFNKEKEYIINKERL